MPRTRPTIALLVSAALGTVTSAAAPALAAGGYNNNGGKGGNAGNGNVKPKEQAKVDPLVIKFESAQKQRVNGMEYLVVSGTDALTGRPARYPVRNMDPQDKTKRPKYDPVTRVAEAVEAAKPGDLLRLELKAGGSNNGEIWLEKIDKFEPAEHEEEPGTFVFYEAFKDAVDGADVYKVTLTKFGKYYDCYAPLVPAESGKGKVPDPRVVAAAEATKKKTLVEATVVPQAGGMLVTSLDPYQVPKQGKFTKLAEADVGGQKSPAVELQQDGQTVTLPVPGKLSGKRWVPDAAVLAEAKKVKPGAAVLYRTREVDGKTFVRQIVAAPKEGAKVASKAGTGTDMTTPTKPDKDAMAEKKDGKKK